MTVNNNAQTVAVTAAGMRMPLLAMLIFVDVNGNISDCVGKAKSRGVGGISGRDGRPGRGVCGLMATNFPFEAGLSLKQALFANDFVVEISGDAIFYANPILCKLSRVSIATIA